MSPTDWSLFLVAAAAGAVSRSLVDGAVARRTGPGFPWGTWIVNVSGCFALGVLTGLGRHHGLSVDARLVLGTGFCGAYTTFSTFTVETVRLVHAGARRAVVNVGLSTVVGLLAAAVGLVVATG